MATRIFISYRRSDTQMAAGRLYDALVARYGSASVFRDKEAIRPGYDWAEEIQKALAGDVVVLALLGPSWADTRDAEGRRRLDDPHDPNRLELEIALQKKVPLIPVLVEAASIPEELPPSLQALTRRHAVRLRDDDWDGDFVRLSDALESLGMTARADEREARVSRRGRSAPSLRLTAAALAVTALVGMVWWGTAKENGNQPPPDLTDVAPSDQKVPDKAEQTSYPNPPADNSDAVRRIAPRVPMLAGTWRDETYPNVVDWISQDGNSFRFVRRGALPNGVLFESAGEGAVEGTRVSHSYQAQYQGGGFSTGRCAGGLTTDGSRIVLQCSDSLLGQFPAVLVRQ
jgi:hypothetical protein